MAKIKLRLFIFCFTTLIFITLAGEAAALNLFDDTLVITGWLRNETAIRLEDRHWVDPVTGAINARLKKGHLARCLTELQVETDWALTPRLLFKTVTRAYYEAKYSLDDDIPEASAAFNGDMDDWDATPRGNNMREDVSLREWHLNYEIGNFIIKAGKMQVVWGEADNARLSDIINPLDLSYMSSWRPWEEIRIPLRMIQLFYIVPDSMYKYQVEVVLNPENYEPISFAPYGDNWYLLGDRPWNPAPFAGLGPFPTQSVGQAVLDATKEGLPDKHSLRNFQGGIRLRGMFGPWEIYLFDFYQRVQGPIFTSTPIPGPFGPYDPFDATFGIRAHYPWINTIGGSFNVFESRTGTVFRGEFAYTPDMPYRIMTPYLIFGSPTIFFGTDYIEKDTFSYMIGFDRPTFIRCLNRDRTFNISGQLFQTFIFDLEDDEYDAATSLGKDGNDDFSTLCTLRMTTEYFDAKFKPELTVGHELTGHNGFLISVLGFEPSYLWRIELGGRWCWGRNYSSGRFGGVKDNDELWVRVEYKF